MRIDEEGLRRSIENFERVEEIIDIIILGEDGGVRRIIFDDNKS